MNDDTCPHCGLKKYEDGVRNCCQEGARDEYSSRFHAVQKRRIERLLSTLSNTSVSKCIKPECDSRVTGNGYRGTGACCKEHASYLCGNCNKPHSYTTKVGREHLQFRVGDWLGVDMNGEPLTVGALTPEQKRHYKAWNDALNRAKSMLD